MVKPINDFINLVQLSTNFIICTTNMTNYSIQGRGERGDEELQAHYLPALGIFCLSSISEPNERLLHLNEPEWVQWHIGLRIQITAISR